MTTPKPQPDIAFSIELDDETDTTALAEGLAMFARPGDVIALSGDLGAGKTALARAFIHAIGNPEEDVPSPTFTLLQTYDTDNGTVHHFDLYRLENPEEALELDIEDAFADGISLIEWPDRLGAFLPADRLDLTLTFPEGATNDSNRIATVVSHGGWDDRLREMGFE